MSYHLTVLADLPVGYWRGDEATGTTLTNLVGGNSATLAGTYTQGQRTFVSGGTGSIRYTNTGRAVVSGVSGIAQNGLERKSYAFECWVQPVGAPTVTRHVFGRSANAIRLGHDGFEFNILSTNGTRYIAKYTVTDWDRAYHVVANYVGGSLSLIVNGQASDNVYLVDQFNDTASTLGLGGLASSTTGDIRASEFAVYNRALTIEEARSHYQAGTEYLEPADLASLFGGTYYSFDDSTTSVAFTWLEDFDKGIVTGGTQVVNGKILSTANGTHTSDLQYVGNLANIAGSRIDWEGTNYTTVDISFDGGITWATCANHSEVPGMTAGANLANKFFMLRKTFSYSTTRHNPQMDRIKITVFQNKTMQANISGAALSVYGSPTPVEFAAPPLFSRDMGVRLANRSYLTVPALVEPIKTIEAWIRVDVGPGTSWQYIFDNRTAANTSGAWLALTDTGIVNSAGFSATYINGVAKSPNISDFVTDQWVHFIGVMTNALSNTLFLSARYGGAEQGSNSFAHLNIYPTTITAAQAASHYNMFLGATTNSVLNTPNATIAEQADRVKAYSYAWNNTRTVIG